MISGKEVGAMKQYVTKYVYEEEEINDDLQDVLNSYAEDGYTLHSSIPYIVEGTTEGFTLIFEKEIEQ